ncbi:MAG: PKD domain-containing protein, partial [Thermoguttaceae bacterium]
QEEGTDTISLAVSIAGTVVATADGRATVQDAPVNSVAIGYRAATEGQEYIGSVASFAPSDPYFSSDDPCTDADGYTASIDWGDDTPPTTGKVVTDNPGGELLVIGSHTYTASGTETVTVTLTDPADNVATATNEIDVADAPIESTIATFQSLDGVLASFLDTNPCATGVSDYTATIGVESFGRSQYYINGLATYNQSTGAIDVRAQNPADFGQDVYDAWVEFSDVGGQEFTSGINDLTPHDAGPLAVTACLSTAVEDAPFTGLVLAKFSDSSGETSANDYSATLDWCSSDAFANTSSAEVVADPSGSGFDVITSNTCLEEGRYLVGVTISDTVASFSAGYACAA